MHAAVRRIALPLLATAAAVVVLATGWLPRDAATDLLRETGPVLVFVVAITAYAELCAISGLFDAAAAVAVRAAAGRRLALWLAVAALATACTVFLSLDTTAVLLTPVVLTMARRTASDPVPFALTVVALANTASLALPVSNLTNLLAALRLSESGHSYVTVMALPAAAVLVTTLVVLAALHRRGIHGRFAAPDPVRAEDPVLLGVAAVVTAAVIGGFVAGEEPAVVAVAGTLALGAAVLVRRRSLGARFDDYVPWQLVLSVAGLFVVVAGAHAHGLDTAAAQVAGTGTSGLDVTRLAATATVAANAINNLPAYLALAPLVEGDPLRTAVQLVAVNAGPLVTPWGSLATLLWWRQVRRHGTDGHRPSWRQVIGQGLLLAPLAVAAGTLAAVLTH